MWFSPVKKQPLNHKRTGEKRDGERTAFSKSCAPVFGFELEKVNYLKYFPQIFPQVMELFSTF